MYILVKQEPRAETIDTLLLFASPKREILEEIILSLFDELYEHELEWAHREDYHKFDDLLKWCIQRMECYQIVEVPFLYD